ncbi:MULTISPECIES: right-handed parallel beta-helix repeat-containing protein [unclassified Solibacillus]|uniref:right-handed parallel beta-helix repeat-containing protein n=1 Tax=unclassified Solibacillus TaxID=2637870 RepID=UPI0030F86E91
MNKLMRWAVLSLLLTFFPLVSHSVAAESLQQLIDETEPHSTLYLKNQTYEGSVTITKPITIIGDKKTKITSLTTGIKIKDTTDITLVSLQFETKQTPIRVEDSKDLVFKNLNLDIDEKGVEFYRVQNVTLSSLKIEGKKEGHFSKKPNAVSLFEGDQIIVKNLFAKNIQDGMYFEKTKNVDVQHTVVEDGRYGLHFMYGTNIQLQHNAVKNNVSGMTIMVVENARIAHNQIERQLQLNSNGMYLYDIEEAQITNNIFKENTTATIWNQVKNTAFTQNMFQSNGTVIHSRRSPTVTVTENEFQGNILTARSDEIGFVLNRNHYDDYNGYDFNADGLGDTDYHSFTSFGQWMVRKPVYQYYVESPSVTLLNKLDQQLSDTQNMVLVDKNPLMMTENKEQSIQLNWLHLLGSTASLFVLFSIWRKLR